MVTLNTRFHAFKQIGAVAGLSLGLLLSRSLPAAAQFPTLYGFGTNIAGQLGNGTDYDSSLPTQSDFYQHCAALAAGADTTLMLALDGTVWSTGDNGSGLLGYQTPKFYSLYPQQIPGLNNVSSIATGSAGLASKSDGTVWAWGDNHYGELANGTTDSMSHFAPTQVMQYGTPLRPLKNIQSVAAGGGYCMALDNDGYIWIWGSNALGTLGTGDGMDYPYAVTLRTLPNVKQIAAGSYHGLALRTDGTVWAWGQNNNGQLGDGTVTNRSTPVQVVGLNHVVAVAATVSCSAALKDDGTVWYWGFFYGFSSTNYDRVPKQMIGLNNINAIALGKAHILAVDYSNNLWGVGDNSRGQLGDQTIGIYETIPKHLTTFTAVTNIAAGWDYSIVETYASNVSGNIRLEGIRDNAPVQYIAMVFKAAGQQDITRYVPVSADAFVEVDNLPRANYTVYIKGAKWLQRVVNLDLSSSNSNALDVTLPAGDANNDNRLDIADFGIFINAYNGDINVSGSGYDVRADFNCDGMVDIADFGLLVNNYGSVGDM